MSETVERRERVPVHTRIDRQAFETIERLAEQRRTTPAQVARTMLETWFTHTRQARHRRENMPSIKTGVKAHDDACLQAEIVRQVAVAAAASRLQLRKPKLRITRP